MRVPLFRLQCGKWEPHFCTELIFLLGAKNYDWGKPGKSSAVAKYVAASQDGFVIEESKPYAEVGYWVGLSIYWQGQLWMGTHPSNPSKDIETDRSLEDLIRENSALMTPEIAQRYENKLPFLFKVLSIGKALSIQAHPNKKLAEQLHAKDPKNYPGKSRTQGVE
jgi:mannose-6-phosphate isomerase